MIRSILPKFTIKYSQVVNRGKPYKADDKIKIIQCNIEHYINI